ncbi:MAG TPA: hypothetical protein QF373_04425 [Verrucomicrobiota bacterium]|jgi:hypothetical protein|nr:hypothetical protein [Verrucomicrobiota bacterium]|tara:strand:+ start:200 stop:493 length:294 start_codon:yes stop_codon:yes gene_type:complete
MRYLFGVPRSGGKKKSVMVGLGMDSDGHKRITTGDNFVVAGGTQDTHEQMTETVVKINEKLTERGKCLNTVERTEFNDIAESVGLKEQPPPPDPENN